MEDTTKQRYTPSLAQASAGGDRERGGHAAKSRVTISMTAICVFSCGCGPTDPGGVRPPFGQSGEIQVAVDTPLHLGLGWLKQQIRWISDGTWSVTEEIGYKNVVGEQDRRWSPGLPLHNAGNYTRVIQALNDDPNFRLAGLPQLELAECDGDQSRVTLRIHDSGSGENRVWVRCAFGTLATLVTAGSGPDVEAAKVIQFVQLVRTQTVGPGFRSAYVGSLPFATVEKGTETGWEVDEPAVLVFRAPDEGGTGETQAAWFDFWNTHKHGENIIPPGVDWERDMALAGLLGVREEVGDSVEIRSVITVTAGTKVELHERIPGDFCVPARRIVRPFHVVVAPKAPVPVFFTEVKLDPVRCGTS